MNLEVSGHNFSLRSKYSICNKPFKVVKIPKLSLSVVLGGKDGMASCLTALRASATSDSPCKICA